MWCAPGSGRARRRCRRPGCRSPAGGWSPAPAARAWSRRSCAPRAAPARGARRGRRRAGAGSPRRVPYAVGTLRPMTRLIRGGRVVTATDTFDADVLIDGESIAAVGTGLQGDEVMDASGCLVIPGLIDNHTHLSMPFGGTWSCDD